MKFQITFILVFLQTIKGIPVANWTENVQNSDLDCWATELSIECTDVDVTFTNSFVLNFAYLSLSSSELQEQVGRIKRLRFRPTKQNFATLQSLSSMTELRLTSLTVNVMADPDLLDMRSAEFLIAYTLSDILSSSSTSLSELNLWEPLGFLRLLEIPKMSNLTRLNVQIPDDKTVPSSIFPANVQFDFNFPKLQTISLSSPVSIDKQEEDEASTCNSGLKWSELFPKSTGPASSVHELEFDIDAHVGAHMEHSQLVSIFPSIDILRIGKFVDTSILNTFPMIWQWTNVKSVELWINIERCDSKYPSLDTLITGLSNKNVERLYANKKCRTRNGPNKWNKSCYKNAMTLKRGPSILDMKALKEFKIILESFQSFPEVVCNSSSSSHDPLFHEAGSLVMSWVTGLWMEQVQGVQVKISGVSAWKKYFELPEIPNVEFIARDEPC